MDLSVRSVHCLNLKWTYYLRTANLPRHDNPPKQTAQAGRALIREAVGVNCRGSAEIGSGGRITLVHKKEAQFLVRPVKKCGRIYFVQIKFQK